MRFAMSNIAWGYEERLAAYARLAAADVTGLEVAPGLLFEHCADPLMPDASALATARAEIDDAGLTLVSMQSLLFGVNGADLFGDSDGRAAFLRGLSRAIALAERLEIPNLVMGSPKQRSHPDTMTTQDAMARAVELLLPVADAAQAAGTVIAMECNPTTYGTNFLTTPDETRAFVQQANHPAITLNFDIGATFLTETFDQVEALLEAALAWTTHVHISEPFLAPSPADPAQAARVLRKLSSSGYDRAVSIEMRRPEDGLTGVEMALTRLTQARTGRVEDI